MINSRLYKMARILSKMSGPSSAISYTQKHLYPPPKPITSKLSLYFGFPHQTPIWISHLSNSCYYIGLSNPPSLDHMKISRVQHEARHCVIFSSLLSVSPSNVETSSSVPCSRNPQPIFFPRCERPSFTPTQNNVQYYILDVLICIFFHSWRQYKTFWTRCQQAFPQN